MNATTLRIAGLLAAFAAWNVCAAPITADEARKAVAKWVAARPAAHMEADFATDAIEAVDSVAGSDGTNIFHVVSLRGGGYVVASADDGINPIVAFSDEGTFVKSSGNPLWDLLNDDLPNRAKDGDDANARAGGAPSVARSEWDDLLSGDDSLDRGVSSVSDVRVAALLSSKWDQTTNSKGQYCYNYYTPYNYYCGCVATAGSQLMRFHQWPTGNVDPQTRTCYVNGYSSSRTMKGGTYSWTSMPLVPDICTLTSTQQSAIGKLCYDVGVAVGMNWTSTGSGADTCDLADAFTEVFGYANAKRRYTGSSSVTFTDAEMKRGIYANLDAGYPVCLGIRGSAGGHAIVADGYGYYNGSVYTHLNMGWSGSHNVWYALPRIDADYDFTVVYRLVYNVFPTGSGELLTGRVLDASGQPVSGASVFAVNGSDPTDGRETATNGKGIYAFKVTGGQSWTVSVSAPGYETQSMSVAVPSSTSSSIGNSWGNDFSLSAASATKSNLYVHHAFLTSQEGDTGEVSAETEFAKGETIRMHTGFGNNGASTAPGPFVVRHEVFDSSMSLVGSWDYTNADDLVAGRVLQWGGYAWSGLQSLPVGSYVYRVTVDPGGDMSESSEADNTMSVSFTVVQSESPLAAVSISGASSVQPGSRTAYVGRAYLADGTVVDADCVWTVDSGFAYASIDSSSGVLTAGVPSSAASVVIRATCTYNGSVKSATKVVSVQAAVPLATALDNFVLSFETGGDAPWYGQTATSYDGIDAAKSGEIGNNEQSWMETTVAGPGTLTFRYLVSSEQNYDHFLFIHNENVLVSESGVEETWTQYSIEVPSGFHTFRWEYQKDVSLSSGDDAVYVDQVQWSTAAALSSISIVGASELAAGSSAQMSCVATMSDSSSKSVVPEWSISSGSQYGTISSGGVLYAYPSVSDATLTVRAAYSEDGIEKSAVKVVAVRGVLPPPGAPVVVSSGAGTADSADIAWSAASNASTYDVYRSTGTSRPDVPIASGLAALRYSDAGAEPGVAYNYWVAAVNAAGRSVSEMASAHRLASLNVDPENVRFDCGESSRTLSVRSNVEWSYSADSSWISLRDSGDSLVVEAQANESEDPRSAKILVVTGKNLDFPVAVEVVVNQDGRPAEDPGVVDFAFVETETSEGGYALFTAASESGGLLRLFDVKTPVSLLWGLGNVGTADFDGGLATEIDIRDSSGASVYCDWAVDDLLLKAGDSVDMAFSSGEWKKFDPGVYTVAAGIDPDGDYDEPDRANNFAEFRFAVRDPVSLAEALDCTALEFSTQDEAWYGTAGIGEDGEDCAMTQLLGDNAVNAMSSSVSGAGTLSFKYRVSTEAGYDVFKFKVDGELKFSDSGESEWRTFRCELGDGDHVFEWIYAKDSGMSVGDDCVYLDQVVWKAKRTDDPPEGLTASDGTYYGYVRLSWNPVDDALSYVVERREREGEGEWTVAYDGSYESYVYDRSALGGVDCLYRVKAVFEDGESQWSDGQESGWRKPEITKPSSRKVPGAGGAEGIDMRANCAWKVVSDSTWLTVATTNGVGDFKLVYRFERNDSGNERTAKVTVYEAFGTAREASRSFNVTQGVPAVDPGEQVDLSVAADCGLAFTTSQDAPWVGQTRISHDGLHSMRSGEIGANSTSRVETVFSCGGTLTFWWGTSSESSDTLSLHVGGECVGSISGYKGTVPDNWKQVSVEIPEGGASVAWVYAKDGSSDKGADAGFVDQIVWTPNPRKVEPDDEWWDDHTDLLEALGLSWDDRADAAAMQSPGSGGNGGKCHRDGTPMYVWEDFVAGTDPLDSGSLFTATIEIVDGAPAVGWSPKLSDEKTALRNYIVYGRKDLQSGGWEPVAEGRESEYGFFMVSVEMK